MRPTTDKNTEADAIASRVEEFLANGGEIQEIPIGQSAHTLRYVSSGSRRKYAAPVLRPLHIREPK